MPLVFKKELNGENTIPNSLVPILIGIMLLIVGYKLPFINNHQIIVFGLGGLLITIGVLMVRDKTILELNRHDLKLKRTIFSKEIIKRFDLNKIENLSYQQDVKSNSYTTKGKVKILGIDVTPESMKEYYYHKEIVSFNYNGKLIEIGKYKRYFDGKKLVQSIRELQQTEHNKA